VDFEKTYDCVDCNFPRFTLPEFGFPPPTINLIMSCNTSYSLSFKWNGEKLDSFKPRRGLRQEDPLYLIYLFFAWRNYLLWYNKRLL